MPALWGQDTFIEKAGGSEIIGQMWAFEDKAGRPCCLIPEATALFQERSEALLEGRREALFFYVARCYRYERPQAGRYREFTQLGLEILGPSPQQALLRSQAICTGFLDSLGLDYELNTAVKRGLSYYRKATASRCDVHAWVRSNKWSAAAPIGRSWVRHRTGAAGIGAWVRPITPIL